MNNKNQSKYTLWSILFGLGLVLAGLSACHSSKKVVYPPDNIVPTDNSLLWRISENGLKKPSYLYGTIHIIPKDELSFSEATRNALNKCEKITFEIDLKDMFNLRTQFSLMTKAFMKNGKTLKDVLNAEDYAFVHAKMEEKGLGLPMFERLKPMFLSMMLSSDDAGTGGGMGMGKNSSMTSVEMELWKITKKQKIKSSGLETVDFQMGIFDAIPYDAQAKMLIEELRKSNGESDQLEVMMQLYKDQNITAMQQSIKTESDEMGQFEDILLGNRNRNWIPKMRDYMLNQPTFFAVGAGHLGGPEGVIALLRREGYR